MRRARVGIAVVAVVAAGLGALLAAARGVYAHCDTLGGPVVTDARAALEKGDATPVLKWVKAENEAEAKSAFQKALAVRSKGPEARELADMYFFETIVRLHRAGEGAPYTGLKAAGEVEPPVAAADKAIADGNVDALAKQIGQAAEKGVRERFERLILAKQHRDDSVEAGRDYVEAYVVFVHYVEGLHSTIAAGGAHHGHGGEEHGEEGEGHAQ